MRHRLRVAALFAIGLLAAGTAARSAVDTGALAPALVRDASSVVQPERAVLLAVTRAGTRLVAAGERGVIVLSDDNGASWRQAAVPTSVTITAVAFADANAGWAVGHSGVVLHTRNGGTTWQRQFDGIAAAKAALADAIAQHGGHAAGYVHLARQLVADGPDAPFLALRAIDARHALVVGANGLFFATADGGSTWQPRMAAIANRRGLHYYGLAAAGDVLYVAGEAGLLERSRDGGQTFSAVPIPYHGTFFDIAAPRAGRIALVGLRGTMYTTNDGGAHFARIGSPVQAALSSIAPLNDGSYVVTTQAGGVLRWRPGRSRLEALPVPPLPPLSGIAQAADGSLIVVGFMGAVRLPRGGQR